MGSGGHNRKPAELHIAEGTHRADRHGGGPVIAEGRPEKPHFENAYASDLWDKVVDDLWWCKSLDASMLEITCHMYGLYRVSLAAAEQDPVDKDARIAVTSYWSKFEKGCAVLGMNPVDRSRLQVEKPKHQGVRRRGG